MAVTNLNPRWDWVLTGELWVGRWLIILPLNWLAPEKGQPVGVEAFTNINLFSLFVLLVIAAPIIETLLECSLPYWILSRFMRPVFAPIFIIISAVMMAALHLVSPMAVVNALITEAFIAGVYALAARRGQLDAFVHATTFHSAINLVGWAMILFHWT
jgi:hypothetical protein